MRQESRPGGDAAGAQETSMLREWLVKKLDALDRPTEHPAIPPFPSAAAGYGARRLRAPSLLSLVAAALLVYGAPALTFAAEPINFTS
jgi:hypothetical protein